MSTMAFDSQSILNDFIGGSHVVGTDTTTHLIQSDRVTLSNKIGKLVGNIVSFFKRDETKTSALISYWTVETVLTAIIIANLTSAFALACAAFIYLYGTYALFSAINALVKERK